MDTLKKHAWMWKKSYETDDTRWLPLKIYSIQCTARAKVVANRRKEMMSPDLRRVWISKHWTASDATNVPPAKWKCKLMLWLFWLLFFFFFWITFKNLARKKQKRLCSCSKAMTSVKGKLHRRLILYSSWFLRPAEAGNYLYVLFFFLQKNRSIQKVK